MAIIFLSNGKYFSCRTYPVEVIDKMKATLQMGIEELRTVELCPMRKLYMAFSFYQS